MPGFAAFASHAPGREVRNEDLPVHFPDIKERTGICSRRVADDETVASMANEVVRALMKELNLHARDCGGIVLSTSSLAVNEHADELTHMLGFPSDCPVTGLNDACTGFVSAVKEGVQIAKNTDRHVIVVSSEHLSSMTDFADPNTGMLFGDFAAGAVIAKNGRHRILDVFSRVLENQPETVGLREVPDAMDIRGERGKRVCLAMPGGKFLYKKVPEMMVKLVDMGIARYNNRVGPYHRQWEILRDSIARVCGHQPNGRILNKMKEVFQQMWMMEPSIDDGMSDRANIASASIPAALAQRRFARWDDMIIACPAVGGGPNVEWGKLTEGNILIAMDGNEDRVGAI